MPSNPKKILNNLMNSVASYFLEHKYIVTYSKWVGR